MNTVETLSTLEENNFSDRGDSSLDSSAAYLYILQNGYPCELSGWTHTSEDAKGFLRDRAGAATAVVTGLGAGSEYSYKVYQFASEHGGTNSLSVNGGADVDTTASASDVAAASGTATADTDGKITFTFTRVSHIVGLSGLAIGRLTPAGSSIDLEPIFSAMESLDTKIQNTGLEDANTYASSKEVYSQSPYMHARVLSC